MCPRSAKRSSPKEGAGDAGCALHPRSRVQSARVKTHTSIQVQRKHSDIPHAMALRLMARAPRRRILLVVTVAAGLKANATRLDHLRHRRLGISNGCQNHTLLPYAARLRQTLRMSLSLQLSCLIPGVQSSTVTAIRNPTHCARRSRPPQRTPFQKQLFRSPPARSTWQSREAPNPSAGILHPARVEAVQNSETPTEIGANSNLPSMESQIEPAERMGMRIVVTQHSLPVLHRPVRRA